MLMQPVFKIVM